MDQGATQQPSGNGGIAAGDDRNGDASGDRLPPLHGRLPSGEIVRYSSREWRDHKRARDSGQSGEGRKEKPVRGPGQSAAPHSVGPKVTAPPPIANGGTTEERKPASRRRTAKSDAAACGAFVGAAFGAASLALTGGWHFAATKDEEREIGEALAECLDTLPTPVGDAVSKGGPWLKLGARLGGAAMSRMAMLRQAQMQAAAANMASQAGSNVSPMPPPRPGARGPIAEPAATVEAPDPSKAGTGINPFGAGDVIAPTPIEVGA